MIYNKNIDYEKNKECFICLEINNTKSIINLEKFCQYYKKCKCSGVVHENCLNDWYNYKSNCPICRITVERIIPFSEKIKNKFKNIYRKPKKIIVNILPIIFYSILGFIYVLFIFVCIEIYIKTKENILSKNQLDDTCYYNPISPQDL